MKTQFATMTPSVPPSVPRRLLDLGCGKSIVCARVFNCVVLCVCCVVLCIRSLCPVYSTVLCFSVLIPFFFGTGTGLIGKLWHKKDTLTAPPVYLVGVDMSSLMIAEATEVCIRTCTNI
jgi:hypothetical protein